MSVIILSDTSTPQDQQQVERLLLALRIFWSPAVATALSYLGVRVTLG